ncbi:MAG: bifunctional DNA primase/polymerase [Nocardioidaceae bacterium]|nr:bifunctional DNA primase/polymerase [Nocardioidaceae bacterium]
MTGPDVLASAIELARRGMFVFPVDNPELARCAGIGRTHDPATCEERGKHPCVSFTKAASSDPHQIAGWFTGNPRNVGVACGLSNLVVVDEDVLGDFARYAASVGEAVPDTFTVQTGRGQHFYFRARADVDLGNVEGALKTYGVNIRGRGGYVVGPGSLHASGALYAVLDDRDPAPLPAWLVTALRTPQSASNGSPWGTFEVGPRGLDAVPEVIAGKRDDSPGERHEVLVRYACSLRARDVPMREAEHLFKLVWHRCEQPPVCATPMTWDEAKAQLVDVYERYPVKVHRPDPQPNPDADDGDDASPFTPGGSFILDTPASPTPIWGDGEDVLLADGEALIIAGPQGLGKTSLAQQLALGRCGFGEYADLLGYPIKPGEGRVLYLAMDRPRQVARSFRRMVGEAWRAELDEHLSVWQGPPPADLAKHTGLLLDLCRKADADTVVVDSLKDAAVGLTDDEVGASYNRARQTAVTAGVQLVECHHNRKLLGGVKTERRTIDDLYGSTWLTSGAGSVLLLSGAPGDPIVGLHHVKQPASEVGPLKVIHDHETGRSTVWHSTDLLTVATTPGGISAVDAARALFETDKPTASEKEKARRKLDRLVRDGLLRVTQEGNVATNQPKKWRSL